MREYDSCWPVCLQIGGMVGWQQAAEPICPFSKKAAIANSVLGCAWILAEKEIRVNAILPGLIWMPFIGNGMEDERQKTFGS